MKKILLGCLLLLCTSCTKTVGHFTLMDVQWVYVTAKEKSID